MSRLPAAATAAGGRDRGDGVRHVVIAKAPVPGRVKTRLCPPCTPVQAAAIAEASLAATLHTVLTAATGAREDRARPVLALDGAPGPWLPAGFEIVAQQGDGLDERLTAAFAHCFATAPDRPVLLVGMDTPQLSPRHLARAARLLDTHDAVLGPAPDGGYWLIGLRHLASSAIHGVPMSAEDTFDRQLDRLVRCGYRVAVTDTLIDVDDAHDARAVAALVPRSRFVEVVHDALSPQAVT